MPLEIQTYLTIILSLNTVSSELSDFERGKVVCIDMTTPVNFCPTILCQAQCSVLHMYPSFNPCHSPTSGARELCPWCGSEETPYKKIQSIFWLP